jgi:hypothetical protein
MNANVSFSDQGSLSMLKGVLLVHNVLVILHSDV